MDRTALALAVMIALWFAVLVTQVHYGLRSVATMTITGAAARGRVTCWASTRSDCFNGPVASKAG